MNRTAARATLILIAALLLTPATVAQTIPGGPGLDLSDQDAIPVTHARADDTLFPVQINGWWGQMNQIGYLVIYPDFLWTDYRYQNLSRAVAQNQLTGYIDYQGRYIIPPIYPYADRFEDGFAVVSDGEKYGFINRANDVVFPARLDGARRFREGYAAIQVGDRVGYINKAGQVAIEPKYAAGRSFHDGLAAVRFTDAQGRPSVWGYILKSEREAFRNENGAITGLGDFNNGLAMARVGEKWGYLNRAFRFVIEPRFEAARDFSQDIGLAAVKLDDQWGFITKTGEFAIEPQFAEADDFVTQLAMIAIRREADSPELAYGFTNRVMNRGIEPQFDWAYPYFQGYARVALGSSFAYIGPTGRVLWDPRDAEVGFYDYRPLADAARRQYPLRPDLRDIHPPQPRNGPDMSYPPEYLYDEGLPLPDGEPGSLEALGTRVNPAP